MAIECTSQQLLHTVENILSECNGHIGYKYPETYANFICTAVSNKKTTLCSSVHTPLNSF